MGFFFLFPRVWLYSFDSRTDNFHIADTAAYQGENNRDGEENWCVNWQEIHAVALKMVQFPPELRAVGGIDGMTE